MAVTNLLRQFNFICVRRFEQQDDSQFIPYRTVILDRTSVRYKETFQAVRESFTCLGRFVCEKNLSYSFV